MRARTRRGHGPEDTRGTGPRTQVDKGGVEVAQSTGFIGVQANGQMDSKVR